MIKDILNGDCFACLKVKGELIDYLCLDKPAGKEAVKQDIYEPQIMNIDLGMVPIFSGQGLGFSFIK